MISDSTLDAPSTAPRYIEIKHQLTRLLIEGVWKPGEMIPPERSLAEQFNASIGTVRKAIDTLTSQNILIRRQGKGTFVVDHTPGRSLYYFYHLLPRKGPRVYPVTEHLSLSRRKAKALEAESLRIRVGASVFQICNRVYLAGEPTVIDSIVLPVKLFPKLTSALFRNRPSTIYSLYQESFGISVVRASERLRSVAADVKTAEKLGISPMHPLLQVRRVAYTYNNQPVEIRVSLVNTVRNEYGAEIGTNFEAFDDKAPDLASLPKLPSL